MHSRILFKGTAAAVAARRIRHILGPVMSKEGWNCSAHEVKLLNTSSGTDFNKDKGCLSAHNMARYSLLLSRFEVKLSLKCYMDVH